MAMAMWVRLDDRLMFSFQLLAVPRSCGDTVHEQDRHVDKGAWCPRLEVRS